MLFNGGEGGIRTLEAGYPTQHLSRVPLSATQPLLLGLQVSTSVKPSALFYSTKNSPKYQPVFLLILRMSFLRPRQTFAARRF